MQRIELTAGHIAQCHRWMEGDALSEKAKHRLRCILQYLEQAASMAEVSAMFNVTPNTLRRWLEQFNPNDASSLEEKSRRPATVRSTQIASPVVALIREYRVASPKMGKEDIVHALQQDHGVQVSASAVGRVIERECLYFADSPLHMRKRFQARKTTSAPAVAASAPVAVEQPVLTVVQPVVSSTPYKRGKWILSTIAVSAVLLAMAIGYSTGKETANAEQRELRLQKMETQTSTTPSFLELSVTHDQ